MEVEHELSASFASLSLNETPIQSEACTNEKQESTVEELSFAEIKGTAGPVLSETPQARPVKINRRTLSLMLDGDDADEFLNAEEVLEPSFGGLDSMIQEYIQIFGNASPEEKIDLQTKPVETNNILTHTDLLNLS